MFMGVSFERLQKLRKEARYMQDDLKKETKQTVQNKADVQAFVQRKLQVLNQKSGARFQRDAARVVRRNLQNSAE